MKWIPQLKTPGRDSTSNLIAKDLFDIKDFSFQLGREYKSFKGFEINHLHKLDDREFYSWALKLTSVWQTMC